MAKELFKTDDRNKAHAKLEELIKKHPSAECREDPNAEEPYSVWDGPAERVVEESREEAKAQTPQVVVTFSEEEIASIAAQVAKILSKGEEN